MITKNPPAPPEAAVPRPRQPGRFSHSYDFDPTHGYELPQLLEVAAPEGPADFAEFWRGTYDEARAIPQKLTSREIGSSSGSHRLFVLRYDSLGGVRVGAWLAVPTAHHFDRAVLYGHGYGGWERGPELERLSPLTLGIYPCARGFHLSAARDIPATGHRHVLHGIGSRETYSHRGAAADFWGAVTAMVTLHPAAADRLHYEGGSFGGGLGALLLPWDSRFHRAFLDMPSFGHHPLRVTMPCEGSGRSVSEHYRKHPEVLEVLRYFDAATAATHMRIPVMVAPALFDPYVPPPGQFAVYNGLRGPRHLFVREAAHFPWPGEEKEGLRMMREWQQWVDKGEEGPD